MFTYNKGNWLSKDKNETIDSFITKKYNILLNKFDELEEKNELDEKISEKFNIFARNYQDNEIMLMMYRKNWFLNQFFR